MQVTDGRGEAAVLQTLHDPNRGGIELPEICPVRAALMRFFVEQAVASRAELRGDTAVGAFGAARDRRAFDAEGALADPGEVRLVSRTADQQADSEHQQQKTHSPEPNPNDDAPAFYTAGRGGASNRGA